MDINILDERIIAQRRARALAGSRGHLYPSPSAAWLQGWNAAIKYAKQIAESDDICNHCGRLIGLEEWNMDDAGTVLCDKCYNKLYNNHIKQ